MVVMCEYTYSTHTHTYSLHTHTHTHTHTRTRTHTHRRWLSLIPGLHEGMNWAAIMHRVQETMRMQTKQQIIQTLRMLLCCYVVAMWLCCYVAMLICCTPPTHHPLYTHAPHSFHTHTHTHTSQHTTHNTTHTHTHTHYRGSV